jgi:hypothetical protein
MVSGGDKVELEARIENSVCVCCGHQARLLVRQDKFLMLIYAGKKHVVADERTTAA